MIHALIRTESDSDLSEQLLENVNENTWVYEPDATSTFPFIEPPDLCSPVKWALDSLTLFEKKGILKSFKETVLNISISLPDDKEEMEGFVSMMKIPEEYLASLSQFKCGIEIEVG